MASKTNIAVQAQGFYFSPPPGGKSTNDGTSFERPKSTMQEAIDAATGSSPPPAGDNIFVVSSAQGGSFPQGFILSDFIQFSGDNVSITGDAPVVVELASFLGCLLTSASNSRAAGTVFNIDGQQFLRLTCGLINVTGTGGAIAVNITGNCDNLFNIFNQITLVSDDSIGFNITSTSPTPIDINGDIVSMDGNDTTFFNYNPVSLSDQCAVNISSVNSNGATGTTGFIGESGHLIVRNEIINVETIVHVKNGAEVDFVSVSASGDIIVDPGGILTVILLDHESGTITNNGTLNGLINGVPFGTYRQKHEEQSVLNASDFTTQDPTGLDAPLQVLFGAAQFGSSDPVELDASGNITINQSDQYNFRVFLQYGRAGAGGVAILLFRILVNGTQLGNTQYSTLSTSQTAFPIEFSGPLDLVATDVVNIEVIRDGAGFDEGSLFPLTANLGGVNPSPSAMISLRRNRLVQPV